MVPDVNDTAWWDKFHAAHPEAKTMAQWILERLDGKDPTTIPETEFESAQLLVNSLAGTLERYGAQLGGGG